MATHLHEIAGRYQVLEEAGRGGMGSVYRCVDTTLGREVAVKQVGRSPGESVTDQARALREARSTAALNHRNVVSVFDAVAEGDHVWLVMEYVAGRTVAQMLSEEGPLAPERAARIGAQVADGLAAAHGRGTVHRDVKPGNVLVSPDDTAKISDFGIARTAGDPTLTGSGILSGTPSYMAPEVARGDDPGPASDVWSLGATLFTAVEGRPPYDGPNAVALLMSVASEEPPVPQRAGPLTGPISRMLDPDPVSRWSMADAAHALHRIGAEPAPPDTREETAAGGAARTAPPSAAAASAATASEPRPGAQDNGTARPPSPERPLRRRRGPVLLLVALVALVAVGGLALVVLDQDAGDDPAAGSASGQGTDGGSDASSSSDGSSEEDGGSPAAVARVRFVEDYYAALPSDTEAGYARLAPSYRRSLSYDDYQGFWSTVEEVTVEDTAPAGPTAVDVTLLYDGSDEEVRRIHLERGGEEGWLITGDEVVG